MDRVWGANAHGLGKSYCFKSFKWRVRIYILYNLRIKNSKPFIFSKNGIPVDSIKKIGNPPNNNFNNVIRLELHRNNESQNPNDNIEGNIDINNIGEEKI